MKSFVIKTMLPLLVIIRIVQGQIPVEYLRIAAENNPGLQAGYKVYEAALQKVAQVSALPDPSLSFGYFISPVETRVGPQRMRLSLTQMFPWFGALKAQGDAAALLAESRFQAFLEARNKLWHQVAAAYYPLYENYRLQQLERENAEILESYKTIALQKFQNGDGAMVDVLRADIMLREAQTSLNILTDKEKSLRSAFNQLLNRDEDQPVQMADSLSLDPIQPESLKDSMLVHSPVLRELELKGSSAQAEERSAEKQGWPKIGLGLDYVFIDKRTDMDMTDNGKDVLMPMLSVSIPLYRGKYNAARQEARLMQESYRLRREDVRNQLVSQYETVSYEIRQKQRLAVLYRQQIQASEQALNILFTAYGNSGKSFEEVLRMEQQRLRYQKMEATALSELHIAVAKLNYLTAHVPQGLP